MAANPGRVSAAKALIGVDAGRHVEDVLAETAPSGRDRALAWYLALGVLRRRAHVDAALAPHLRQPLASLDREVRAALRLGAFEKLYARTKSHAAVHQAVDVTRALGAARASGLVNAVLRRVRAPQGLSRADALDHPPWLVARWDDRYGADAVTAWCERNNEPAVLFVVARDAEALAQRWSAMGVDTDTAPVVVASTPLLGVLRVEGQVGSPTELPGFDEGAFWVQDAASVAVADLVGAGKGTRVLDACAAPGGKAFRLTAAGAEVTAVDLSAERLALLRGSAERLGLNVAVRAHDWAQGPLPEGAWDAVLVDAPCTALGLLRRHPDIRWRRTLLDVTRAPELQAAILANAASHVAPGGRLVYAVCSPEPEEGSRVVEQFIDQHRAFSLDATLSTAPPSGDEDAFWAARLVRR